MKTIKFLDRRVASSLAAVGLLLGMVTPAVLPAFASADVLTDRSIALSSSKADDSGVTYVVNFTPAVNAGAVVIDFCSESPIPGYACSKPSGLATTSTTSTGSATATAILSNRAVKVVYSMTAATPVTLTLTGYHNPTAVGTFYARILTYTDSTAADDYTSATVIGSPKDQGGAALATTSEIGISAAVRESLTFCVAGGTAVITDGCGDAASHEPSLTLGEDDGSGTLALDTTHISTGDIYTQISTNAVTGAVVSMKSDATGCGGLVRQGAATNNCNIAPETGTSGFLAGAAKFGVKATAAADGTGAFGTFQGVGTYATQYFMNYVSGDGSGVTGAYGDPVLNTASGPAANKNTKLTFAATAGPQTPAGSYKANLNLIATGTY